MLWNSAHRIAMRALNDKLFTSVLDPKIIQSYITNQRILDAMASQIIVQNYQKTINQSISLIFDGGTVTHIKWIAIGFNFRRNEQSKF